MPGSVEWVSRGGAGGGRGTARIRTATPRWIWTRRRKRRGSWAKWKTSPMAAAAVRIGAARGLAQPGDSAVLRALLGLHTRSHCWIFRRSFWCRSSLLCPALLCPTWRWCARKSGRFWTRKQSGGEDAQRVMMWKTIWVLYCGFLLYSRHTVYEVAPTHTHTRTHTCILWHRLINTHTHTHTKIMTPTQTNTRTHTHTYV